MRTPEPMLDTIDQHWRSQGWDVADLTCFRMEDDENGDNVEDAPPSNDGKSFSQADLNRVAAREKEQGKRAAEEAIAKQLGVTLEEAKTIIGDARKRSDSEKSEAQRERDAAEVEKKAAESERAAAVRERHEARIERVLARAGVTDDKKITRLMRLVDGEVEGGASVEDVTKAVSDLKEEWPELFPTGGEPDKKTPPNGDPKGPPRKPKKEEDAYARGAERAKLAGNEINGYAMLAQT